MTSSVAPASAAGVAPAALRGGDVARNRELADDVLAGEAGPHADLVALNAAAALLVGGVATDLRAGLALARGALADGSAAGLRDRWVVASGTHDAAGR